METVVEKFIVDMSDTGAQKYLKAAMKGKNSQQVTTNDVRKICAYTNSERIIDKYVNNSNKLAFVVISKHCNYFCYNCYVTIAKYSNCFVLFCFICLFYFSFENIKGEEQFVNKQEIVSSF